MKRYDSINNEFETLETYHSSTHLGYAFSSLTLSRLVILTNICFFSICVHYDAEIECAVIDMMQLKNLHGNITIERVYDCA